MEQYAEQEEEVEEQEEEEVDVQINCPKPLPHFLALMSSILRARRSGRMPT